MSEVPTVQVHLHFTMTGTSPHRLLDILFCAERVVAVEYDYLTALDLATGSAEQCAGAFASIIANEGLSVALDSAERRREIPYEKLDIIRIYDGGWDERK